MPAHELPHRHIALAAAAIAGTVAGAVAVVLLWLHAEDLAPGGRRLEQPYSRLMPGPALQSAPQIDLAAYRAEQQRRLGGSGWVDARQRIVHIPIDDAMALLLERAASAPEAGR
ncbi:hypothetical protein [Roseateles sp.]|uniref:hypothetical protein n=1 Tax=Roseateles sp. TaxID=1971397 RepID=UPI002DFCA306|nr:hypothetical protein [Roseateles sp.]